VNQKPKSVAGTTAIALLLIGAVALALRPGTETIVVDDSPPVEPPADGTAVIHSLRAPGGLAPFGVQIVDPTHTVEVQFLTGPGCATLLTSGDPWPTTHPECASRVDVVGVIGGLGITNTSQTLVGVTLTVPRACYDRIERGMAWPPGIPECTN
jgi:hypothetical protein